VHGVGLQTIGNIIRGDTNFWVKQKEEGFVNRVADTPDASREMAEASFAELLDLLSDKSGDDSGGSKEGPSP